MPPGPFNEAALHVIRTSPHVQSVFEDGIMGISVVQYVVIWIELITYADLPRGSIQLGVSIESAIPNHSLRDRLLRKCYLDIQLSCLEPNVGY